MVLVDSLSIKSDDNCYIGNIDFTITNKIIYSHLHEEINTLLNNSEYNGISLRSNTIKTFVSKLQNAHFNSVNSRSPLVQELYTLHHICKGLYEYNTKYLGLSHQEFRAKILFPNLIYILIRCTPKAHSFLQTCIKSIYSEIQNNSYGIIQRYEKSYYLDHDTIKTNVLYEFLGNGLKKFDPANDVDNVNLFYKQVFRKIFHYFLMKEEKVHTSYDSLWNIETNLSKLLNTPFRLMIYKDVLFDLQVKKYGQTSPIYDQINYNFNIFRNVIITNELRNVYFSSKVDTLMLDSEQYKLLKIYNNEHASDRILKQLENLPIIYKLLKCVKIVNPKARPYNEMLIKPEVVKSAILEELLHPFRNMFAEQNVYSIFEKIAQNFIDKVLTGEYINLLSLTTVKINQISFISQIKQFVNICINEAITDGRRLN